ILAKFQPRDRVDFNKTGFFPYAPPDGGLASKQMSSKKKDKFRISIGFVCNADGSEKLEPFFIRKFKKPQCFKKQALEQRRFYYCNNKGHG
ncbi:hypothetical protein PAXRUDRAFT_140374, partial [Paxillus rubicundulus Ve08.2h10]